MNNNLIYVENGKVITGVRDVSITTLTIPNGVEKISDWAFEDCPMLRSITIPSSVKEIMQGAFANCPNLVSIKVSQDNPFLDSRNDCNAIIETKSNKLIVGCRNTLIPDSVLRIGTYAFSGCSNLTSIVIPESVTILEEYAFEDCTKLTSIEIPSSVREIDPMTFMGCINVLSIKVNPNNPIYDSRNCCNAIIETDTNTLLMGCQSTCIPNSAVEIGKDAFYDCKSLTSIIIPNGVVKISTCAFEYCSGLTSITFSNSVTSIGDNAFSGCSALTFVDLPDSITTIGAYAFLNCLSLVSINIPKAVTDIPHGLFYGCSKLTSIDIPNDVLSIGKNVFYGCKNLKDIVIPYRVFGIDNEAFSGCPAQITINLTIKYIDLGLPSGTLWAERDTEDTTGCFLPSYEQAQELIECCDFYLRESADGTRYIGAQGPSGQFVYFPLREYEGTPGPSGCCWCGDEASDPEFGYFLLLSEATITVGVGRRSLGFPYRLVRA